MNIEICKKCLMERKPSSENIDDISCCIQKTDFSIAFTIVELLTREDRPNTKCLQIVGRYKTGRGVYFCHAWCIYHGAKIDLPTDECISVEDVNSNLINNVN